MGKTNKQMDQREYAINLIEGYKKDFLDLWKKYLGSDLECRITINIAECRLILRDSDYISTEWLIKMSRDLGDSYLEIEYLRNYNK